MPTTLREISKGRRASAAAEVMVRSAADEREVDEAYELAARTFGPDYFVASANKVRIRELEPLHDLRDLIVAVCDGAVVGMVRIVDRRVRLKTRALKVGGVTSVCVHPKFQQRGYGRTLMEIAIRRMRQRGDACSIAFTRRAVDGFYPKLGYVGLGCHPEMTVTFPLAGALEERSIDASRLPKPDSRQSEAYAEAYENSYGSLPMSFERSEAWWEKLLLRMSPEIPSEQFTAVTVGRRVVGYFIARQRQIIEAASLPDDQETVACEVIAHVARQGNNHAFLLPLNHWLLHRLRRYNHTLSVRYSWDGGHMVRALDHQLAEAIGGKATERAGALDVADHSQACAWALRVMGVVPSESGSISVPMLPTWTRMDEF